MSIYFNIIDIGKYVIKKVIYNIGSTIPAMTVITKTKVPEARD